MQVLTERITALITVIQSFAFSPPPPTVLAASKYHSGIIPFSCQCSDAFHGCPTYVFCSWRRGVCDPSEGKKKRKKQLAVLKCVL